MEKTIEVKLVVRPYKDKITGEARVFEGVVLATPNGEIPVKFNTVFEKNFIINALKAQKEGK